uniref:Uncharacterized protein n=1 Tax=Sphaerodactylus townsendi TaxID=933632 RepID=A0ACB8G518_9SAUR
MSRNTRHCHPGSSSPSLSAFARASREAELQRGMAQREPAGSVIARSAAAPGWPNPVSVEQKLWLPWAGQGPGWSRACDGTCSGCPVSSATFCEPGSLGRPQRQCFLMRSVAGVVPSTDDNRLDVIANNEEPE